MSEVRIFYVCFHEGMTTEHRPVDPGDLGSLQALVKGDLERYDCRHARLPGFSVWFNQMPDRTAAVPHQTPFCPGALYGDFFVTRERGANIIGVTKTEFKKLDTLLRFYLRGSRETT